MSRIISIANSCPFVTDALYFICVNLCPICGSTLFSFSSSWLLGVLAFTFSCCRTSSIDIHELVRAQQHLAIRFPYVLSGSGVVRVGLPHVGESSQPNL